MLEAQQSPRPEDRIAARRLAQDVETRVAD